MELGGKSRKELQTLAKRHGIKANLKTAELIELLTAALSTEDADGVTLQSTPSEECCGPAQAEAEAEASMLKEDTSNDVHISESEKLPPAPKEQPAPAEVQTETEEPASASGPPSPAVKAETKSSEAELTWSVLGKRLPPAPTIKLFDQLRAPPPPPQAASAPAESCGSSDAEPSTTEAPEVPASAASMSEEVAPAAPAASKSRRVTSGNKRPLWQMTPFVPQKSRRKPTTHESVPSCAEKSGSRSFEVKSLDAARKAREQHRERDERSAALKEAARRRRDAAIARLHAEPLNSDGVGQPLAPRGQAQAQVRLPSATSSKTQKHTRSSVHEVARV